MASSRSVIAGESPAAAVRGKEVAESRPFTEASLDRADGGCAAVKGRSLTNCGTSSADKTAASATRFSSVEYSARNSFSGKASGPWASRISRTAVANSFCSRRAASASFPCSRNRQICRRQRMIPANGLAPAKKGVWEDAITVAASFRPRFPRKVRKKIRQCPDSPDCRSRPFPTNLQAYRIWLCNPMPAAIMIRGRFCTKRSRISGSNRVTRCRRSSVTTRSSSQANL